MLFDGKVPQPYWVEAFFTSCFLGNLLPSSILADNKSLYEILLKRKPEYTALRIFGSACYPSLRPYASNKLDPKSLKCVFLGYNEKYKGYRCLHPPTGKVYISRHVLFNEEVFPFTSTYSHLQQTSPTALTSAWQQSFMSSHTAPETDDPSTSQSFDVPFQKTTEPCLQVTPLQTVQQTSSLRSEDQCLQLGVPEAVSTARHSTPEMQPLSPSQGSVSRNVSPIQFGSLNPNYLENLSDQSSSSSTLNSEDDKNKTECEAELQQSSASDLNNSKISLKTRAQEELISQSIHVVTLGESQHPTITQSKIGITKPNSRYVLFTVTSPSATPKTVSEALKYPGWN